MRSIKTDITTTSKNIKSHIFKSEDNREAAKYNTEILKQCKYVFEKALGKEEDTILQPGSEFSNSVVLEPMFKNHEHWNKMGEFITTGATYHLEEVSEEEREKDLDRGNH